MNVSIRTDLECIAGVVSLPECCIPGPNEQGAVRRDVTRADNAIDLINGQLPPVPGVC